MEAEQLLRVGGVFTLENWSPFEPILSKGGLLIGYSKKMHRDGYGRQCLGLVGRTQSHNKVVNEGLDNLNNVYFYTTSKPTHTWYLTLVKTNTTAVAGMTYATPTYTEVTTGDCSGNRPAWGAGASSSQQVTNASAAVFNMTSSITIYGISLLGADGANYNVFGDTGSSNGKLVSFGLLGTSQPVISGNVVNVTYTVTAASST